MTGKGKKERIGQEANRTSRIRTVTKEQDRGGYTSRIKNLTGQLQWEQDGFRNTFGKGRPRSQQSQQDNEST